MSFEANQAVFGFFGHCHPYKELTLTIMSKCWSYTLQPYDPNELLPIFSADFTLNGQI